MSSIESLARLQAPQLVSVRRCTTCAGTGVRHPENDGSCFNCYDCKRSGGSFMVKDAVWKEAWPEYAELKRSLNQKYKGTNEQFRAHLNLCLCCLSKRLKRKLKKEDFDLTLPINDLIVLGMEMGAALALENLEDAVRR